MDKTKAKIISIVLALGLVVGSLLVVLGPLVANLDSSLDRAGCYWVGLLQGFLVITGWALLITWKPKTDQ